MCPCYQGTALLAISISKKIHIVNITMFSSQSYSQCNYLWKHKNLKSKCWRSERKKGWRKQFGHLGRAKYIHHNFPTFKFQEVQASLQTFRMFRCFVSLLPPVFPFTVVSSCTWWWGFEGCGSLWCSWSWGNSRPPGQSRTCAVKSTRWFWSGHRQSSPRCSDGGLRSREQGNFWFVGSDAGSVCWTCDKSPLCFINFTKSTFSYRLQTAHRQTSPLQQGCPWGSGQARTPSSAPRCRTDGGWQSGRRRPGGQQGWCIPPQSVTVKMLTLRHLKYETNAAEEAGVLTWGERAILIMVMMGGRRRRVSFKQRSNKLRSFSWW